MMEPICFIEDEDCILSAEDSALFEAWLARACDDHDSDIGGEA